MSDNTLYFFRLGRVAFYANGLLHKVQTWQEKKVSVEPNQTTIPVKYLQEMILANSIKCCTWTRNPSTETFPQSDASRRHFSRCWFCSLMLPETNLKHIIILLLLRNEQRYWETISSQISAKAYWTSATRKAHDMVFQFDKNERISGEWMKQIKETVQTSIRGE